MTPAEPGGAATAAVDVGTLLRLASTSVEASPATGTLILRTGPDEREVPLSIVIEPLVRMHLTQDLGSTSARALGEAAVAAVGAVADRNIRFDRRTARWYSTEPERSDLIDGIVHAFVVGGVPARPDHHATIEIVVHVDPHGRPWARRTTAGGESAVRDILFAGIDVWKPLGRLLDSPGATELDDEELVELLSPAVSDTLATRNIRLTWDESVSVPSATVRLDDVSESGSSLHWALSFSGGTLTPTEISELAAPQRPVVRVRDTWVVRSAADLKLVRRSQKGSLNAGETTAALLTGRLPSGDREVTVVSKTELSAALRRPCRAEDVPVPTGIAGSLRAYQREGLAWLARNAALGLGSCLADDMGLGKSLTAIAFHLHLRSHGMTGPTLVVCPASVLGAWEREVGRWAPRETVRRYHGDGRILDPTADITLTTYATMRLDADELSRQHWNLLIADEAQTVKNPRSLIAQALRRFQARHRLALSGTPIQNSLDDLWAIIDWTTPGLLGNRTLFRRRFSTPIAKGDEAARERLNDLTKVVVLRRRKSDPGIAPELPPKTFLELSVPLSDEQIGLYQALVDESLTDISQLDEIERRGRILKLLTELKQVCNHPAQFLDESTPMLAGRSGKLDALLDITNIFVAEGAAGLVFTQFVKMGELILRHLRDQRLRVGFLHGGLSLPDRQRLVDGFQGGEFDVLVLSLHAAGTGLTLTRAEHVVHYDRWWNPAVEDQATDRAYRIGQTRPVQVHRLTSEGTLEERIADLLTRKGALADAILDVEQSGRTFTELDDEDLSRLVKLQSVTS
ncbi:DEAD/DEAH box helicase [Micromonospora sonneratiae]|uniref:DEAD/DEAH box helicase n=1 Tax=Micromonospora sonneratiae TaxID=1184706 RepID=A0ABW3YBS3_9ACTN